MVEGGRGNITFHYSDAWAAANVGTQKITAEHIAEKDEREICTDAFPPHVTHLTCQVFHIYHHF